jgi:undecaprenyl-diphosphatase
MRPTPPARRARPSSANPSAAAGRGATSWPIRPAWPGRDLSSAAVDGQARRLLRRALVVLAAGVVVAAVLHLVADRHAVALAAACAGSCRLAMREVTRFGEGWETLLPAGLVILACAARRLRGIPVGERLARLGWIMAFVATAVGGGGGGAALIKNAVGRARPFVDVGDVLALRPLAFSSQWAAFPSGHAATAGATAAVLALLFPRSGPVALVVFALVAASRVAVGAHFPSDVAAGFALGFAVTLMVAAAFLKRHRVFQICGGRLWRRPVLRPSGAAG